MRNAKELLLTYISADPEQAGALFAEDGILELPYLASLGIAAKYCGPTDIAAFLFFLHEKIYPGFRFENVSIHIETLNQAFGEYHIRARSAISGKVVHQQFFGHLLVEGGKIKLLREAINSIAAAQAFFPNGLADVAIDAQTRTY